MKNKDVQPLFVKAETGMKLFSRSRNSLMKEAAEAEAIVRIGRNVLISVKNWRVITTVFAEVNDGRGRKWIKRQLT